MYKYINKYYKTSARTSGNDKNSLLSSPSRHAYHYIVIIVMAYPIYITSVFIIVLLSMIISCSFSYDDHKWPVPSTPHRLVQRRARFMLSSIYVFVISLICFFCSAAPVRFAAEVGNKVAVGRVSPRGFTLLRMRCADKLH